MERLIQKLGLKRVKATIAIIVVLTLIIAPLSYVLPMAFAAEENINVHTSTSYNADNNTVDISIVASPKEGIDATIESISMPDGSTVEGSTATYTADKNDNYKFKVNYVLNSTGEQRSMTLAPEDPELASDLNDSVGKGALSQSITIRVNEIANSEVSVKLMANGGGTFSNGQTTYTFTAQMGQPLTIPSNVKIILNNIDREFAFWSTNKNASSNVDEFNMGQPLAGSVELYAIYRDKTNNRYEITLDGNGGQFTNDLSWIRRYTSVKGELFSPKEIDLSLIKGEEVFMYWAWDKEGTKKVEFPVSPTKDITFYAIYQPKESEKTVTVQLFAGYNGENYGKFADGSKMKKITIPYNSVFAEPEAPIAIEGKEFSHWVNCEIKYDFSKSVTEDPLLLVAKYKDAEAVVTHTVTLDADKGTLAYGTQITNEVKHGTAFAKPADPSYEGKKFLHWSLSTEKDKVAYNFDAPVIGDITLEAQFAEKVYGITFNPNGGNFTGHDSSYKLQETVKHGSWLSEPTNLIPPAGKELAYWAYESVDGEKYEFSKPLGNNVKDNFTLYAVYKDAAKFVVAAHANDGDFITKFDKEPVKTIAKLDVYAGMEYDLNNLGITEIKSPAGQKFANWSLDMNAKAGENVFDFNQKITVSGDFNVYAIYETISHKVTINAGEGTLSDGGKTNEVFVKVGETLIKPTNPTPPVGMELDKWIDKATNKPFDFTKPIDKDVEIQAVYKQTLYKVTGIANGGKFNVSLTGDVEVESSSKLDAYYGNIFVEGDLRITKIIPPVGKEFKNWSSDKNAKPGENVYEFGKTITENISIYAIYEDIKYNVIMDAVDGKFNDGKNKIELDVVHGNTVAKPENLTAPEGKMLDYWSEKKDSKEAKDTDEFVFTTTIVKDTNLYAIYADDVNANGKPDYSETKWVVTFNTDGADNSTNSAYKNQIILDGLRAEMPPISVNPVKTGYEFLYWIIDGQSEDVGYDFNTPINKDTSIKAIYKKIVYDVNLHSGKGGFNGEPQTSFKVEHGDKFEENKAPSSILTSPKTPANMIFDYWSEKETSNQAYNTDRYDFSTAIVKNATLYAIYAQDNDNNGTPDYRQDDLKVTFDMNGGLDQNVESYVRPATAVAKPTDDPTAPKGMAFDYWSLKQNPEQGKEQYEFATLIKADTILFAIYGVDTNGNGVPDYRDTYYNVSFDENGGKHIAVKTEFEVLTGTTVKPIVSPTAPAGMTFDYWSDNKDSKEAFETDSFNFSAEIVKKTDIYAIYAEDVNENGTPDYKETPHKVTLKENGGLFPVDTKIEHKVLNAMTFAEPAFTVTAPAGMTFDYWSTISSAKDGSDKFSFATKIYKDTDLYAIYAEDKNGNNVPDYKDTYFDVEFFENGGTLAEDVQTKFEVLTGTMVNPIASPTAPAGMAFDYWSDNKDSKEAFETDSFNFSAEIIKKTDIFAIFAEDKDGDGKPDYRQDDFKVTFNMNGGLDSNFDVSVKPAATVEKPSKVPTAPEGMAFDYWSTKSDSIGDIVNNQYDFDTQIKADTELFAIYGVDENGNGIPDYRDIYHDVTLLENGGIFPTDSQKVAQVLTGMTFAEPAFAVTAPTGMAFDYWSENKASSEAYVTDSFDFSTAIVEKTDLYAIYAEDVNGNGVPDYRDTHFDVTLIENGGVFPADAKTVTSVLAGTVFEEPTFTVTAPTGMAFDYWSKNPSPAQGEEKFNFASTISTNTDLYAIYTKDENGNGIPDYRDTYYDVEFLANGGALVADIQTKFEVLSGMTINPITSPLAPEGMAFDYWSENKDAQGNYVINQFNFANKIEKKTDLHAIYAEDKDGDGKPDYRQDDLKVSFNMNGGLDQNFNVMVRPAATVAKPSKAPTAPEGMAFDYWSLNSDSKGEIEKNQFNFASQIKADIEVFAIYGVDENGNGIPDYRDSYYDVKISANNGAFANGTQTDYKVLSGMTFAEPKVTITAPAGTVFDYWSLNQNAKEGADIYDFNSKIVKNVQLYAVFAEDKNGNGVPDYKDAKHVITATAGYNGRISPNGASSILTGTSKTFIIVPNTGYDIASITVDGARVGIANTYTFAEVKADHTIHVTFRARSTGGGNTGGGSTGGGNSGGSTDDGTIGDDNSGGADTLLPPSIGTDIGADTIAPIVINPDGTVNIDQFIPELPGFEFDGFQTPEEEIVDSDIPLDNLDTLEPKWTEIPDEDIALAQGHGAHNHILLIILLTLTSLTGGMLVYREREKFLNKEEA